ncbi:DUF3168 domain-containing protein [Parasphingopyxis algicola]|uniref:DUF3168 domain-containing protein n=1 Tax=Parasphingopyxis algicola TaxID=2026624 RepID=UPI0015A1B171|nr:DUF3168 domain-containing protein [Parasphingopyxis algicola]QLC23656.1 DUF3168 domain-containing protein [Parasphingopyxis algicola]
MSAAIQLTAALMEALESHVPLAGRLNGVFAAPPVRGTPPYALLGPIEARDWSTKTEAGRELRFSVTILEQEEQAGRLAELMAELETAIDAVPRDVAGWRIASCVLVRSRIDRSGEPWSGILDYRARLLAA